MTISLMPRGLVVAVIALVASNVSAGERSYTFYDIFFPACSDDPYTEAADISDSGVVVGNYEPGDCVIHGFTWFNGVMTDLDSTYEQGIFRAAESIARTGTVLGLGNPDEVLVLDDDLLQVMPIPVGCVEQWNPNNINDAGTMVVGQCKNGGGGLPSVYWIEQRTGLRLEMLPDLPEDATGDARDVNDAGVVVGIVESEQRSFMWQDGVLTEILNGLGGQGVVVTAINNHGLIVGLAGTPNGFPAMSYDMHTGEMTVLGGGGAKAVNDRGSACGDKTIDLAFEHAILYENGEEIDLHEFFPLFFHNSDAESINNYGWIVGDSDDIQGVTHGFLLVPNYDKGDYDGDEDVDHQDFQHFQRCFSAENFSPNRLHVGCSVFDFDDDVDLDLDDYAAFQSAFTGPTAPNNNPNGPG